MSISMRWDSLGQLQGHARVFCTLSLSTSFPWWTRENSEKEQGMVGKNRKKSKKEGKRETLQGFVIASLAPMFAFVKNSLAR